jgi:hypothetical protein
MNENFSAASQHATALFLCYVARASPVIRCHRKAVVSVTSMAPREKLSSAHTLLLVLRESLPKGCHIKKELIVQTHYP